jgi:putative FmdB family regulatory protein
MPTYEYHCDACGNDFEEFQSIKAAPIKKCPKCGKNKVRRLISSGAGVIFKGSGFYITDYRSEGYQKDAKAASGESGGGEKKADTPAESKPAAETKTETKAEAKPATPPPAPPKTENKASKSAKKK